MESKKDVADMFNLLPDDILCHILSFLPTNDSAATSILARRWRFLWLYVPTLDFVGCYPYDYTLCRLMETASRVIKSHRAQNLDTFRLIAIDHALGRDVETQGEEVATWVSTAVARNVRNLDLTFFGGVKFHQSFLTCKTLVELRLTGVGWFGITMVENVCLPSLKVLHLDNVPFESAESLPHLLSGCHVLEKLEIRRFLDKFNFQLSLPTVTSLTLCYDVLYFINRSFCDDMSCFLKYWQVYRHEINAPALRYLKADHCLSMHLSAETLNSLVEADICLDDEEIEGDYEFCMSLLNFVYDVCNVKSLKLSFGRLELIDMALPDTRFGTSVMRFNSLTKLEVAGDWRLFVKILENADSLEVLIINQVPDIYLNYLDYWEKPQQVPTCVTSRLRTITIDGFRSTEQEFEMVGYLLRNAKVLMSMRIGGNSVWQPISNAFEIISRFPRGCEACELELFYLIN